ncbi:MAG: hypothetical protein IJ538_04170 [Clostridia bacterium]|nr:hypothetical protein [Clostridia bacterium]
MLLALVGITGVGKSFLCDKICEKLNFKKVNTIRTRKPRAGENVNNFKTISELDELEKQGEIAYRFKVFGGEYAYLSSEIQSNENWIFEMHYTTIFDWKNIRPDIKTIYIFPKSVEMAKQKLHERGLSAEKETERFNEIDEHIEAMKNENLKNQFDYFFYNDYTDDSVEKLINLVKKIIE